MTQQIINIGQADKGNGDPLRTAFSKVNENFTELYDLIEAGGNIDLSAVDQHVIPATDSTYDLGSSTKQWRSLYVSTDTVYIDNTPITVSNNTLSVGTGENQVTLATLDDVATIPKGDPGADGNDGAPGADGNDGAPGADALWNWQGAYNAGPQYQEGDIVSYQGSTYRRNATGNSVVGEPPTNTTYWQIVSQKGADGAAGVDANPDAVVNGVNIVSLDSLGNLTFTNGEQIKTNFLGGGLELYHSSDNTIGIYDGYARINTFTTGGAKHTWEFNDAGKLTTPGDIQLGAASYLRFSDSSFQGTAFVGDATRLYGNLDQDVDVIARPPSTVTATTTAGAGGPFIGQFEISEPFDILEVQTGWEMNTGTEQSPIWTTVTNASPNPGEYWIYLASGFEFEFAPNTAYTFRNPTPVLRTWTFDTNGTLTFPDGTTTTGDTVVAPDVYDIQSIGNTLIQTSANAGAKTWTFGSDGTLTLPGDLHGAEVFLSGEQPEPIVIGHTLNITPAPNASDKKFGFRIDQSDGVYLNSYLDMPTAENDKHVSISFALTDLVGPDSIGYIWNQGTDTNVTSLNNAFNIFANNTNIKLTTQATSGNFNTWTFGTNGSLTFPDGESSIYTLDPATSGGINGIAINGKDRTYIGIQNEAFGYGWDFRAFGLSDYSTTLKPAIKFPGSGWLQEDYTDIMNDNVPLQLGSQGSITLTARLNGLSQTEHNWVFGRDGSLTLPDAGIVKVGEDTAQVGSSLTIADDGSGGLVGWSSQALSIAYDANIISTYPVGSTITWQDGSTATITGYDDYGPTYIDIFWDTPKTGTLFPIILKTADYAAATTSPEWEFDTNGFLTVPGTIVLPEGVITLMGEVDPGIVLGSSINSVFVRTLNGINQYEWKFGTDGSLTLPSGMAIETTYGGAPTLVVDGKTNTVELRSDDTILIGVNNSSGNVYIGNPNGGGQVDIVGPKFRVFADAPTASTGAVGDQAGQVAFNGSYIYYCTADYSDGLSNIWKRVAWSADTW
jgi:hypothetical protein